MQKKVSIIMPSYNHEKYIGKAIDSVLRQTYKNWELIIVDDGSKDRSLEIIQYYLNNNGDKIRLFTHPNNANKGISQTYQLGLKNTTGDYIAFLESDDVFLEDSIAFKVDVLDKHAEAILVFTDLDIFGPSKRLLKFADNILNKLRAIIGENKYKPFLPIDILEACIVFSFSVVMVRERAFEKVYFSVPKKYESWIDWWLWAQLGISNKFIYVPEKKTKKRIHGENTALNKDVNYNAYRLKLINFIADYLNNNNTELSARLFEIAFRYDLNIKSIDKKDNMSNVFEIRALKMTSILFPFYLIRYLCKIVVKLIRVKKLIY
jgi:glycosyltransferase involved in cell wall biosynthesis